MARQSYSDETKAAAVAALLAGQSISSVAKEYKIPKGTVAAWKARENPSDLHTEKRERIGSLLIEYLETNLKALKKQAEVFSDEAWLKKQSASDAAVLHGVMTDKAVRLLEALEPNADAGEVGDG